MDMGNRKETLMKGYIRQFSVLAILMVFLLSSCSTTTKSISSWKDSAYTGGYLNNVMVVGVSDKVNNRTMFEDLFAKLLERNGVKAVSAIAVTPPSKKLDKEMIKAEAKKRGIETVFVTHLIGVKEKSVYHPPPVGANPHYGSFGTYYHSVYSYTHYPGYYTKHEYLQLESSVYEVATEKLIWSFRSDTIDAKSVKEVVDSLGKAVMKNLRKDKLLK